MRDDPRDNTDGENENSCNCNSQASVHRLNRDWRCLRFHIKLVRKANTLADTSA